MHSTRANWPKWSRQSEKTQHSKNMTKPEEEPAPRLARSTPDYSKFSCKNPEKGTNAPTTQYAFAEPRPSLGISPLAATTSTTSLRPPAMATNRTREQTHKSCQTTRQTEGCYTTSPCSHTRRLSTNPWSLKIFQQLPNSSPSLKRTQLGTLRQNLLPEQGVSCPRFSKGRSYATHHPWCRPPHTLLGRPQLPLGNRNESLHSLNLRTLCVTPPSRNLRRCPGD